MNGSNSEAACGFELRFDDLVVAGRGYAFPCDASGHVDLDALGDRARDDYLFARALRGRRTSMPVVRRAGAVPTGPFGSLA